MLSKNEVKYIQSLRHKKHRDKLNLFIAEGPKIIGELLNSNFVIEQVYATQQWLHLHASVNIPFTEVSETQLSEISNLKTVNDVLVIARQKHYDFEPVLHNTMTIVLDGIQDPGNMGTIIRIADWFGIKQIVASEDSVELYNPKVVQSSMGSICRVNIWYKALTEWLNEVDVPIYGAMLEGENVYNLTDIREAILLIGNESKGIRDNIKHKINHPITIPKSGDAESLNAAVAAGIIVGCMVNAKSMNSEQ